MKTLYQPVQQYRKLSDEELVYRYAHRGDNASLLALYQKYGVLVQGVINRYLSNPVQAAQAMKAIFVKLADHPFPATHKIFVDWLIGQIRLYCPEVKLPGFSEESHCCLTKRQFLSCCRSTVSHEEAEAIQSHLEQCSWCSQALEGFRKNDGCRTLETESSDFLKQRFTALLIEHRQDPETVRASRRRILKTVKNSAAVLSLLLLFSGYLWAHHQKPDVQPVKPVVTKTQQETPSYNTHPDYALASADEPSAPAAAEPVAVDQKQTSVRTGSDSKQTVHVEMVNLKKQEPEATQAVVRKQVAEPELHIEKAKMGTTEEEVMTID